jgi:hypothetical protein
MKAKEVYEYNLPVHSVCYIAYGNEGGYNDQEEEAIDSFLTSLPKNGIWDFGQDEGSFCSCPAFGLVCDCIKAKYIILE